MASFRCSLGILLFTLSLLKNYGQITQPSPRFEHLSIKNGLVGANIKKIYQDKTGYLWFCSIDGLQRFDGKNFKTFYSHSSQNNCLASDAITDIKQDKFGRYWITTGDHGGLCVYNPSDGTFKLFNASTDTLFSEGGDNLYNIEFTDDGNFALISSYNGFYKFEVTSLKYRRFSTTNSRLFHNWTEEILPLHKNLFLIIVHTGFQVFDVYNNIFYDNSNTPLFKRLLSFQKGDGPRTMTKDNQGRIWFSMWLHVGFYCFDPVLDTIIKVNLDTSMKKKNYDQLVTCMAEDEHGNLYVGTQNNGIYWLDTHTNTVKANFRNDASKPASLISSAVTSLLYDRQKILWVGTASGISKLHRSCDQFIYPFHMIGKSISTGAILQSADEHIWLGTFSGEGLLEFDPHFRLLQQYKKFEGVDHSDESGVGHLFQTSKGTILISRQNGFSILNPATGQKDDFTDLPELSDAGINTAIEDDDNQIWLASWNSKLIRLNPVQRTIKVFQTAGVTYIHSRYKNKLLLLIYDKGYKLVTFDMTTEKLYGEPFYFFKQRDSAFIRQCGEALDVKFYGDEVYVISRVGMHILNNVSGAPQHYNQTNGLPSNRVHSIQKDRKGYIWLGTQQGLSVFNPVSKAFRNYGEREGLDNLEMQIQGLATLKNGMMLAATSTVLAGFFPEKMTAPDVPEEPVITALRFGNEEAPVLSDNHYNVSHNSNSIRIDYSALDFTNPTAIRYQYKLEGFDKEWVQAGNNTSATYNNLSGGNYTFKVKAAGASGAWNDKAGSLHFFVSKPFYKKAWFMGLITIIVLATLYAFFRIRLQRIMEMQHLRNNISSDLHDEVGSTLSSISMLSTSAQFALKNKQTEPAAMLVERINSSSLRILEVMDDIIWAINPQKDSMESIMERIREFINDISDANGLTIRLHVDPLINRLAFPMKTKRNFYLIFKEALANVAAHADCRQIDIDVKKEDHIIRLKIVDDGKGFDADKKSSGNGLKNMKLRAEQIGGSLNVFSEIKKGTTLALTIPLP